jgi:hypothetical protein
MVDDAERAVAASIKSLDSGEADFFKQLDKDIVIIKEDTKAKTNLVYGFNSYRSVIIL